MKIALSLSGKTTNGLFCYPYIFDNFINIPYSVDVYIHTWEENLCAKLYSPKKILVENQNDELIEQILSTINIDKNVDEQVVLKNYAMQLYSIKKSFELIDKNNYDIIIRCRFDIFMQKTNWIHILKELENNEYDLFIPDPIHNWNGYQDRLAIGKSDVMSVYCNNFYNISRLANKHKILHPERLLKFNLEENKIKIKQSNLFNHVITRKINFLDEYMVDRTI